MFRWLYHKLFGKTTTLRLTAQDESATDWHYLRNDLIVGPYTIAQLQQLLSAGQIQPGDPVCRSGWSQWVTLASVLRAAAIPPTRPAAAPSPKSRAAGPTAGPGSIIVSEPEWMSPSSPTDWPWYYSTDNKTQFGPVAYAKLLEMARSGQISPSTMVRRQDYQRWVPLSSVAGKPAPLPSGGPPIPIVVSPSPSVPVGPSPGQSAGIVEWYYSTDRISYSAITSLLWIQGQARVGQLAPNTLVWRKGLPGWVSLTSVAGISFPQQPVAGSSPAPAIPATPSVSVAPSPGPEKHRGATLNLEAGDFLPIARADLKEQAQKVERWGPWFGRRDLIPPADDPRTKLIDRGLVSNGLLSPEQLVEIHSVGAEMERLRPSLVQIEDQAARAGTDAVEAERERKAQLRAQKKADAERRKKERAEAVAQRKATDIIFLGRGVSGRLNDRTSNVEKLKSLELPVLATPAELAEALGLRIPRLRWLAFHTEVASRIHYVQFTVPKKSGGLRTLSAPHRALTLCQQWILRQIVSKLPAGPAVHGFLPGKSILTNARAHVGRDVVINVDLHDFFPSISFRRVRSVFQRAGYSGAVATILALLCSECPRRTVQYSGKSYYVATGPRGLPQGACTSPGLSNLVAGRLDRRLAGLAKKLGLDYTRYADDLTFSGPLPLVRNDSGSQPAEPPDPKSHGIGYLMARIRHIAQDEGFPINHKKSRVLRRHTAQLVTGLVVNDKPSIRRQEIRRLRALLHRARREGLDPQNRAHRPHFRAWLEGKIAYLRMVRPELGEKMLMELRKLTGDA